LNVGFASIKRVVIDCLFVRFAHKPNRKELLDFQHTHWNTKSAAAGRYVKITCVFTQKNAILLGNQQSAVLCLYKIGVGLKYSDENRRSLKIGTLV